MLLRWAKSISTFFRSLQETEYWVVWGTVPIRIALQNSSFH